jgi:hypothetical protein
MDDGPGRPPEVTDDEILTTFETARDAALTATEVADQLAIGRRGVLRTLATEVLSGGILDILPPLPLESDR